MAEIQHISLLCFLVDEGLTFVLTVASKLLILSEKAITRIGVAEGEQRDKGKQMEARVAEGFRQMTRLGAEGIVGDGIKKVVPNGYFSKWFNDKLCIYCAM